MNLIKVNKQEIVRDIVNSDNDGYTLLVYMPFARWRCVGSFICDASRSFPFAMLLVAVKLNSCHELEPQISYEEWSFGSGSVVSIGFSHTVRVSKVSNYLIHWVPI